MRKRLLFEEDPNKIGLYARCHKIYFKDIPIIGDLYFYKNGLDYDGEPLIYICKDKNNKLYFCQTIGISYIRETLIFYISRLNILKLFLNKISIRNLYNKSQNIYYVNSQGGFFITNKEEIKDWLPDSDIYLDYKDV